MSQRAHEQLVRAILVAVSATNRAAVWRQETGVGVPLHGTRPTRYGRVGSADITGILDGGRRIEIEVKTGRARQTPEQRDYQAMIQARGGLYVLARTVEDAVVAVVSASWTYRHTSALRPGADGG